MALCYPLLLKRGYSVGNIRKLLASTQDLDDHIRHLRNQLHVVSYHSDHQIQQLQEANHELRNKLEIQTKSCKLLEQKNMQLIKRMGETGQGGYHINQFENQLAPKVTRMDLRLLNTRLNSEYEVLPYTYFNKNFLYSIEVGMNRKPEIVPIGDKKKEKEEILTFVLNELNKKEMATHKKRYQISHFVFGYYRQDRIFGTQYDLFFNTKNEKTHQHISLFRPFAPLQRIVTEIYDKTNEWINIIMPLYGRLDKLVIFLDTYLNLATMDGKLFLTIVYFGEKGRLAARNILKGMSSKANYTDYAFIERPGNFSRGEGLLVGANDWNRGNVLIFFCDIDIHFNIKFLQRCRLNSAPGAKVYYPIVFSLYNPKLVYMNELMIPKLEDRFVINKDSGFWRAFGFGMVCIYRSDFIFNKGFDTAINGWGWEDVQLYRKLINSNLEVMRSPDPGIFHVWHEKECDKSLPLKQYTMCLGSRAMADGSITQLGMIAYGKNRTNIQ